MNYPIDFGGKLGRLVVGQTRTVYRVEGRTFLRAADAYYAIAKRMVMARYSQIISSMSDGGIWCEWDEAIVDLEEVAFTCGITTSRTGCKNHGVGDVVAFRARAERTRRLFFRNFAPT